MSSPLTGILLQCYGVIREKLKLVHFQNKEKDMIVALWIVGLVVGILALARFVAQLNLEFDLATEKYILCSNSKLGRYYHWLQYIRPWKSLHQAKGVCTLVWHLVYWSIGSLIVYAFYLLTALYALRCFLYLPYWIITHGFVGPRDPGNQLLIMFGSVVWLFALMIGSLVGWIYYLDIKSKRVEACARNQTYRQNVFVAWIRARKRRACPPLEIR